MLTKYKHRMTNSKPTQNVSAESKPGAESKSGAGSRPGAGSKNRTGQKSGAAKSSSVAKKPAAKKTRARRPRYSKAEIHQIFERFHEDLPEPKGELHFVNAFTMLVAVVLSAQATDAGVNKATIPLFAIADSPEKMLALGEDRVRDAIKSIGLFRNKAKNVVALSAQLIESFGGDVPQTREELESLPGVGRKTANVVLNIAFGQPTIAVDTHLFRIGNRLGLAPGKNPLEVELALEKIIPEQFMLHAHHWLILHGRYICKARKPECDKCIIFDLCKAPEKIVQG